jgi:flagellar biosynthesis protein FlhG
VNGQAHKLALRTWGRKRFPLPSVALASGKGGVGKTSLSCSLAVSFARQGRRVLLLDLDLGLANVDMVLGLAPRATVADLLTGECSLDECLVRGPEGILVLPAASGAAELAAASLGDRNRLLECLADAGERADVIVADLGAGVAHGVLELVALADLALIVTTPEPTAFTDAYALAKLLLQRDRRVAERIKLVVNRSASHDESVSVAHRLARVARQFLGFELETVGHVPEDPAAARGVLRRQAFAVAEPDAKASRAVARLARELASRLGLGSGLSAPVLGVEA